MKISAESGQVAASHAAIAVCLFDDEVKAPKLNALGRSSAKAVMQLIAASKFAGKKGETVVHFSDSGSAPVLILQGLGSRKHFTWHGLRLAAGSCIRAARGTGVKSFALASEAKLSEDLTAEGVTRSLVDGLVLGAWTFEHYKSGANGKDKKEIASVAIYYSSPERKRAADKVISPAQISAECTCLARDLGTHPTNVITIDHLTKKAKELSKSGIRVSTVEMAEMKRLGMNLFVAVGQASVMPPRLVIMDWNPRGAKKTYALVGKGLIFDSGGLNIKTSMMEEMKSDMCGAAAVLAAMYGVSKLKPNVRVIGMLACAENSISGNAFRPSDIYTAMNGKTVEIGNTDAEGRLVLADAMCYANKKFKLSGMIDVATLTGAAKIALGSHADCVFTNNDKLQNAILTASERAGERMWPMPLYDEYLDEMRSAVADLNNSAGDRWGGACRAAAFLREFVDETPWVHIDIAPTSFPGPASSIQPKMTASGSAVRTFLEFLRSA